MGEPLWALPPDGDKIVADFDSGTGFYTDDIAPAVDHLYAVDIQNAIHDYDRENVDLSPRTVPMQNA